MSKIQIDLPEDTTKKLKILALKTERPLKSLVALYLVKATDANLIDVDERTKNLELSSATSSASASNTSKKLSVIGGPGASTTPYSYSSNSNPNPLASLTFEQLQEAGITQIPKVKRLLPEEQELLRLKLQQQKDKKHNARVEYFKKQYTKVFGDKILPPAFRPAAIDYILLKYPDNVSLDAYIDTLDTLSISDTEDPEYEFYLYESDIESRETRFIIPVAQNDIYNTIKNYCLLHDLSETLYHMIEYPTPDFETLSAYAEETGHDFISDLLSDGTITEQDIVSALSWQE